MYECKQNISYRSLQMKLWIIQAKVYLPSRYIKLCIVKQNTMALPQRTVHFVDICSMLENIFYHRLEKCRVPFWSTK